MSNPPTAHQLSASLTSQLLPTPSQSFLNSIITPSTTLLQRVAPLPALTATAKHRLLSSPLTTPLLLAPNTPLLPPDVANAHIQARTLPCDTHVEVVDVDDLGRSKWEQIEALESERKGETTKGREVIRVVPTGPAAEQQQSGSSSTQMNTNSTENITTTTTTTSAPSRGPFKLLLQDSNGTQVHALELTRVDKIGYPPRMHIGSKMLLRQGTRVARGVVLLEPGSVVVLGGKVEALDKAWVEGREGVLRERVVKESQEGG